MTRCSLRRKWFISSPSFQEQCITEGNRGRNSRQRMKAGTDAETMKEHKFLDCFLYPLSVCFFIQHRTNMPSDDTAHNRLCTPT